MESDVFVRRAVEGFPTGAGTKDFEKDVFNLIDKVIDVCCEMDEAIVYPGSHEAKIVLGGFSG